MSEKARPNGKLRRLAIACGVIVAAASVAASAASLTVEHDPDVDFTPFKSFAWPSGRGLTAARPDIQAVIVNAINDQLEAKGLEKVDVEQADLYVVTYAISESFGGTVVGFYRPPEWGIGFITVDSRMVSDGALVVDLYRAEDDTLIWHAIAKATVDSREQAKKKVRGYVNKAFRKYPPSKNGK